MAENNNIVPDEEPIPLELDEDKPSPKIVEPKEEPISLVDSGGAGGMSKIKVGGGLGSAAVGMHEKKQFRRPLNVNGTGATRCRIFHSKIADAPLHGLETTINEWLDEEQIEIKHVGHVIGTLEAKMSEPNLIVMVWY
ncbi:MAG TPA: hypothetical protein DCX07_02795 [Phycisphaerales bacterium]|nr:hypothetical protein [Phycisphaerales bacterium]